METRLSPEDWGPAIADCEGPQLVVGGPGTGKTEFLVRRAAHLMNLRQAEAEGLLLLSFSRRGVADLKGRIERQLDRTFGSVPASTFHSLAHRMLETAASRDESRPLPRLLTGPEQVALVGELLRTEDPSAWPLTHRSLLRSESFAREVTDFLLRCRERLIDPETLAELAEQRADWRALPGFFNRYADALAQRNRLDYGTLLSRAVEALDAGEIGVDVVASYRYVLVDEYQDTTATQRALLQRLYTQHRNLTVAADPYQSIYSFRGAELENVARFPTDFPDRDGAPARRVVLTTSFRTPPAILEAAERVTAGGELPGAAGPVTPAPGDGAVESYVFEQQTEEAEWIAAEVQRLHLESGLPYRTMAVFVRSKRRFIPELSRALERRGVPHDVPDSRLADQPAVRMILDCVIAATEPEPEATRAVRRMLLGPLFTASVGSVRELEHRRAAAAPVPWHVTLGSEIEGGGPLADLLADPTWATERPAAHGFWTVWSTLPQFVSLVRDPTRGDERSAWASLGQVLGQLNERDPQATLADYLHLTEQEDFEASPLLSYRQPAGDRLAITTLHQSKGLEFDIVFIADAVRGVLPDLRARESLLGARFLSPALAGDAASYRRFRLQEEMRLAYTAMTRARRRVVWTATVTSGGEGPEGPSRFMGMADPGGGGRAPERQRPVSPLDAEAWLRRMLRDPAQGHARRLAAAVALGNAASWGMRPVAVYAGVAERGPDTGLVAAGHHLSPSQADRYEACPFRYALERRLHVGDEQTVYAVFGTLIHDVLEDAERVAGAAGDERSTLADAVAALDRRWDPAVFGGDPWATAWRRRAEQALAQLYALWPGKGPAVALEADVELHRNGTVWRGRIDRLEKRGDHTAVIDYKTSKNPMSVARAAASLQLGFYLLAVAADPDLAALGPPAEGELWYPLRTRSDSITVRTFDPSQLADVEARLDAVAAGIAAEDWQARPSEDCRRCRARTVCPAWPEGREAFSG
jgi:superfamily I DNA/RNA helicase/RecB family exonuclease